MARGAYCAGNRDLPESGPAERPDYRRNHWWRRRRDCLPPEHPAALFFISFMEDSGYMARAAFIMDKIMHKMGLHGKSFIPLIMGFGCNVPAIMSSRIIESRKARLVTMLVNPLMSCSARLPIYLVMIGAFFPGKASLILLSIYAIGILLAVLMARIFTKFLVKGDDSPFVMELPPYRMPTAKVVLRHTWEKGKQYLKRWVESSW